MLDIAGSFDDKVKIAGAPLYKIERPAQLPDPDNEQPEEFIAANGANVCASLPLSLHIVRQYIVDWTFANECIPFCRVCA